MTVAADAVYKKAIERRKLLRRLWLFFLLFPPTAVMVTFVFLPMASAVWYSVYDWDGLVRGDFIGLGNFRDVLFDSRRNTFLFNAFFNNIRVFVSLMIVQNGLAWPWRWPCYWHANRGAIGFTKWCSSCR